MAEVTIRFDELESGDLPCVCMICGARRDVDLVQRKFAYSPVFAPPGVIKMLMTKRLVADIPLCPTHGGPRLLGYGSSWFGWQPLRTIAIAADRITIDRVHQDFAHALRKHRAEGWHAARDLPRRRMRTGRGPGGGLAGLTVLGILVATMAVLVVVMVFGMFLFMGGAMLWMNSAGPPAGPTLPPPAPAANVAPPPEGVVVGLLAFAPGAGGPGALPWAPLALTARKETFHLLDDADLNKALADLQSKNSSVVATAARRLAAARPAAERRAETARALLGAMANPFPSTREYAAEALGVWGTADDVPDLIAMLGDPDPNARSAAMTALAALKDDRGTAAVAARLSDFLDRTKAGQALETMGPAAEKAVLPLVSQGDAPTRMAACGVLAAVGAPESLPALETAARDPDINVARAAADAVRAVKDRQQGKQP